jgi:hypothetical protein
MVIGSPALRQAERKSEYSYPSWIHRVLPTRPHTRTQRGLFYLILLYDAASVVKSLIYSLLGLSFKA